MDGGDVDKFAKSFPHVWSLPGYLQALRYDVYANTAKAACKREWEWDEECKNVAESLFDRVLSTLF